MKTKLLPKILLGLILGLAAFNSDAQNPGGVATAPTIWYQASAYGPSWPNAGSLGAAANLTITGSPTFSSSGDSLSNYNPYVLFSATGQYASTPAPGLSAANVAALGNTHTTFAAVTNQNTSSNNTASSSPFFFGNSGGTLDQPGLGFSQNGNSATPIYAMMDYYYHTTGSSEYAYQYTGSGITAGASAILMGQADPVTGGTNNLNISYNGQGSTVYMNGIGQTYSLGTVNGNYSSVGGGTNANQNYIFVGDVNQYAMTGRVQEIVMFNSILNNTQTKQVNTYLAVKNGVTLGHDYIDAAGHTIYSLSTNPGNVSNIFGIGAEAANGSLNQPQSNSVSDKRSIVVSNGSHTGTDDSYLMFGANGVSVASQNYADGTVFGGNSVTTATILNAISEKWVTQSTVGGAAGGTWTVTINAGRIAQNGYVLVSSDSTFPAAATFAYALAGGVADNVSIPSGAYVTIAYLQVAPGGILTTPAVWYKPDGATPASWADASGNGINLSVQSGAVTVNAGDANHNFNSWTTGYSSSNYYNYIDPAASNTDLEVNPVFGNYNTSSYLYTPITVFGIARPTSTGNSPITGIDNESVNGAEPALAIKSLHPQFYRFSNGIDQTATSLTATVNQTSIFCSQPYPGASGSAAGNLIIGLDGKDTVIAGQNGSSSVAGPYLKIGYSSFGFGAFQGDIQEVVWYKAALNTADMQKVETYFALKYGTTLAHDYINAAGNTIYDLTANTGYTYNIAGIGHEAANGGLDQRQSNSIDVGKQVLISTTGLANTNDANTVSLSEGQFLLWGDNGLAKSPSVYTGSTFSAVNVRFGAIWKVQNTGNVGTVRVAWPAGLSHLSLIQSADETFDASDVVTDMSANTQTINGVAYNYADVTLADGQYFTFAAKMEHAPGGVFTGLTQWFRADKQVDTTATGGTVTTWSDYTWNIPASNPSTAPSPVYGYGSATYLNFNPGISFTNASQKLYNISVQALQSREFDIFSLTKEGMSGTRYFNIGQNNTDFDGRNWDHPGLYTNSTVAVRDSVYNSFGAVNTSTSANFASNVSSIMYYSFTNNSLSKSLNGLATGTPYTFSHDVGLATGGFIFGANSGNGTSGDDGGFTGNIGELIVYGANNISAEEKNRVDAYLAIKYGITLDKNESYLASDSNVVFDKTDNADYYNNIAGIARDDISALNQKQSRSQITNNADGEITVGLGSIEASNAANTNSFTSDQTWFIWGDNGVTTTLDAANTAFTAPGESGVRMNRIWKAVNTGLGQKVQLQFPQASISAATGEHYVLAMASDENFTTGVSAVDLTADGSNYTVSFTPRSGTFYFTFARIDAVTPVNLQNFTVTTANCNAVLSWTGATESNFSYYEVQTSTDGASFTPGQQIAGTGSGSHYTAQVTLSAATEYIRLGMVDKDGSVRYSDIYTANSNCVAGMPVLYPNPASDVFNITNLGSGQKYIQVFSAGGAVMYKGRIAADKATVNVKGWAPGLYMVSVVTGNGKTVSFKVIVR